MPAKTRVTTLNSRRYAETFAAFVSRSFEYPAITKRLARIAEALPDRFSCLDIGAGTGTVLRDWVMELGRKPGRYLAVEPNPAHASSLRANLDAIGIDANVDETGFFPGYPIPGTFDFVVFSHSLYWTPDPVACMRHASRACMPGGKVVAILQGPFGVYSMYRLFNPFFERDCPPGPDHGFSSTELVAGLREQGIDAKVTFDSTYFDLTGLLDPGNEAERDEYLSFCLQIEFKDLQEPLKWDVLAYIEAASVAQNGRLNWYEPNATVLVTP